MGSIRCTSAGCENSAMVGNKKAVRSTVRKVMCENLGQDTASPSNPRILRILRVLRAPPTAQPTNASSAYSRIPRILREPQPTNTSYANRAMIPATTTKKTFRTNAFPRSTAILLPKYDPATLQTIIGSAIWSNTYLFIKK